MRSEKREIFLLNLKKHLEPKMREKLDPEARWSYFDRQNPNSLSKMPEIKHFIDHLLDQFIERCINAFSNFSQEDSDSLGSMHQTHNASAFMNLFLFLEENGFVFENQFEKPLIFWSGKIARVKAAQDTGGISDNHIPSISVMLDVCKSIQEIQGGYDAYILMLNSAISRVFAMHARGVVTVYINSEKLSEDAGFTSSNVFWNVELSVLMQKYFLGVLRDIFIYRYSHVNKTWDEGFSIFSMNRKNIPIYRRDFHHKHDRPDHANRFKKPNATQDECTQWMLSKARPSITYDRLQAIAKIWRERSRNKIATSNMVTIPVRSTQYS